MGFTASPTAYMRQGWEAEDQNREEKELRGLRIAGQKSQNERTAFGLETDRAKQAEWNKGAENRDLTRTVQNQQLTATHDALVAQQALDVMNSGIAPGREADFFGSVMSKLKVVPGNVQVQPGRGGFSFRSEAGEQGFVNPEQMKALLERVAYNDVFRQVAQDNLKRAKTTGSYVDPLTNSVHEVTGEEAARRGWVSLDAQKGALGLQGAQANIDSTKAQEAARRAQAGAYKERGLQYKDQRENPERYMKGKTSSRNIDTTTLKYFDSVVDDLSSTTDQMGNTVPDPYVKDTLSLAMPEYMSKFNLDPANYRSTAVRVRQTFDGFENEFIEDCRAKNITPNPQRAKAYAKAKTLMAVKQHLSGETQPAPQQTPQPSGGEKSLPTEGNNGMGKGLQVTSPASTNVQQVPQTKTSPVTTSAVQGASVRGAVKRPENLRIDESGIVWAEGQNGQPRRVAMPPKQYGLMGGSQLTTKLRDGGQQYTVLSNGALEYISMLVRNGLDIPEQFKNELRAVNGSKDVQALQQIFGQSF